MDLTLSEDQRLLKESVDRFIAQGYDFAVRRRIVESAQRFDSGVWRSMAGFGWLGLPLPEADGGFGGTAVEVGIVMEGLGRGLVLEPWLTTAVVGGGLIAGAGTAAQRAHWLPRLAAGDLRVAFAHTESPFTSLGGPCATRAEHDAQGWRLNGVKRLVLDGPAADAFLVSARVGERLALFFVPRDAQGLRVVPFEILDGRLAANLEFDGLRLDDAHRLAGAEDADAVIAAVIDRAVAASCAEAVGCMQVLLDATIAYSKTRVQFGRPIGANQVLQHRMVDMAIQLEEARAMALRAALHASAEPRVRAREASGAKLKIARAARFVAENAVQLHGGMGVTEELNIGAYFKRLLAFEKTYGTPAEHQARLVALRAAQPGPNGE
ncbi:MAG: hypothetical protein RIS35_1336 [Pseudomonadota bacterium]|jgi:alkylation response protein AidB-like acyl-CoA dehydrogenase